MSKPNPEVFPLELWYFVLIWALTFVLFSISFSTYFFVFSHFRVFVICSLAVWFWLVRVRSLAYDI